MTTLYPNISTQLQLRYAGNEEGSFTFPRTLQTLDASIQQYQEKTILSFELQYPGLENSIPVIYDLSSRQLDLDHFISEERLIEIAENDFLFKGTYVQFQPGGGMETWDLAARIKGRLRKDQLGFIRSPVMEPINN